MPLIADARTRAAAAATKVETLTTQTTLLAGVHAPDGIDDLQKQADAAAAFAAKTREAADEATQALADAGDAARTGPQRPVLELARDRYAQHADHLARKDGIEAAAEQARAAAQARRRSSRRRRRGPGRP